MSSSSERRHPASLLPSSQHNTTLIWLMRQPVDEAMIKHVCSVVEDVIVIDEAPPAPSKSAEASLPSPPVTPTKGGFPAETSTPPSSTGRSSAAADPSGIPSLVDFVSALCRRSNVQASTFLSTLVYLNKLKNKLPRMAKGGMPCTRHRVFLATLIVTAKYLNDSSPKNKYWTAYAKSIVTDPKGGRALFGFDHAEVNLMEKQLLYLLDFDLRFQEDDLVDALGHFFPRTVPRARPQMALLVTPQKPGQAVHPVLPLTPTSPVQQSRRQVIPVTVRSNDMEDDDDDGMSSASPSPSPTRATFATADLAKRELAITAQAKTKRAEAIHKLETRMRNASVETPIKLTAPPPPPSPVRQRVASLGLSRTSTASSSASSSSLSLTDGSSATSESEAMLSSASSGSEQEGPVPYYAQRQARIVGGPVGAVNLEDSDSDDMHDLHSAKDTIGRTTRRKFILRPVPSSAFRTSTGSRRPSSASTIGPSSPIRPPLTSSKYMPNPNASPRNTSTMPLRVLPKSMSCHTIGPKSRVASLVSQKDIAEEETTISSAASLPSLAVQRARDVVGRVWGGLKGTDTSISSSSSASSLSRRIAHSKSIPHLNAGNTGHHRTSALDWRAATEEATETNKKENDYRTQVSMETMLMLMDVEAAMGQS